MKVALFVRLSTLCWNGNDVNIKRILSFNENSFIKNGNIQVLIVKNHADVYMQLFFLLLKL